ncbi:hypothetical protein ACMFMG_004089 [Clarireedia jacksonii]
MARNSQNPDTPVRSLRRSARIEALNVTRSQVAPPADPASAVRDPVRRVRSTPVRAAQVKTQRRVLSSTGESSRPATAGPSNALARPAMITPHANPSIFSRHGDAFGATFGTGPRYNSTNRKFYQLYVWKNPTDPTYRPDKINSLGYTDAHHIRVNRLQEDICNDKIGGRWLKNERLSLLKLQYDMGRVERYNAEMLFALDHIIMDDDRDFSCGSNKPVPAGLTYAVNEKGKVIETTDWAALEALETQVETTTTTTTTTTSDD